MIKVYYNKNKDTFDITYLVFILGAGTYLCRSNETIRIAQLDDGTPIDPVTVEAYASSRDFSKAYEKLDNEEDPIWYSIYASSDDMKTHLRNRMKFAAREARYKTRRLNFTDRLIPHFIKNILAI